MIGFGLFILALLVVALLLVVLGYSLDQRRQSMERIKKAEIERAPNRLLTETMMLVATTLAEDSLTPIFTERQRKDFAALLGKWNDQQREPRELT